MLRDDHLAHPKARRADEPNTVKSKAKGPTKAERERMGRIKEIGCLIHRLRGDGYCPCEVHHLLSGNKRRGHRYTVGLSPWFHRGVPYDGLTRKQCEAMYGPSLALSPKGFRERWGDDEELLEIQDRMIEATDLECL